MYHYAEEDMQHSDEHCKHVKSSTFIAVYP